ncbi:MAG TPA: uL15m family ribosomal protein [Candidatus Nanoarchaeia archaeon]|nr:uL15m family ribosomal protein [Candidatus Nanoarchaeia archaeon]
MVVHRRKKSTKQRGSKTHGWGAKKKHRGAGNRGGRGRAGSGKRASSIRPSIWADENYFGKHGFKKKGIVTKIHAVNIHYLEENIKKLVEQKNAVEKNGTYEINIENIGFNKLLGTGKITKKFIIKAPYYSEEAAAKIKAKGGSVIGKEIKAEE